MATGYLPYDLDPRLLLPPDLREWLPEGDLALSLLDVVGELDLSAIERAHEGKDARGRAGYHPRMAAAARHRGPQGLGRRAPRQRSAPWRAFRSCYVACR